MKDANGWDIVEGCLVSWTDFGKKRKGWLRKIREDGIAEVAEEVSGGKRLIRLERVVVEKPTMFQKAKAIGDGKTVAATNAARRRGLGPRKKKD